MTSLRDTARSRLTASFTADNDVPPRSKKWSQPADLLLRDAEHLRPGGRQPLFGRGRGAS